MATIVKFEVEIQKFLFSQNEITKYHGEFKLIQIVKNIIRILDTMRYYKTVKYYEIL